ncbi:MAG TPA: MlaD family protein [Gillisia sp.]|nr:MlaD family protein [Gillisia sp.]
MKQNTSKNVMLGIFVILGITIFVIAVYFIGNTQNLFGKSTRITSVFTNVNGLQLGNNVRYAGVNVGTVKGIKIVNDTAIAVDMFINEETVALIKRNSVANISSDGLVGSMIVNIIPGKEASNEMVRQGDTIRSITQKATADMLNTLNTTNENAALLTADLLKITAAINSGEGLVGELIMDKDMASDFKKSIANLETTSNSALRTINRLNNLLSQVNYEESVAGVLLSDRESAGQVEGIIDRFEEASEQIHRITTNLEEFTINLKQSDGALNLVTQDVEFRNNLDTTLKNVEEASERFNENMEALKNNFLFRGYFRKLEREQRRLERDN